jgi:RNA-directed DNA polymerase
MAGTQRPEPISTRQARIAELASRQPRLQLTTLSHHIDQTWLMEAWRKIRKDGAVGIDGVHASEYETQLDERVAELEDSVKAGRWRAPPARRAYIPKGNGRRPLGIPTIEDKLLQRAFTMLLEPVFEQDFLDCSYGFRPRRSAHQALERVRDGLRAMGGGWVLDVDLRSFFDTVDHAILRELVEERVRDGVVLRTIGKWLNAGVLEEGTVLRDSRGTPQGGVISPLLANLYLHHAVDRWFAEMVMPRLHGRAFMVRYADDIVMAFEREDDARRVMAVLPHRLERFKLELNTEKTRLVNFVSPTRGGNDADSFNFLGFTLFWGTSRKGGSTIRWKTSKKSLNKTLRAFNEWCRRNYHQPIAMQHAALCRSLRGHDAYFGLTMNGRALQQLRTRVTRIWHKWMGRRSQRSRLTWDRFTRLLERFPLSRARVVHSVFQVT